MKQTLTEEIRSRLAKQLQIPETQIADDEDLVEALGADSLDIVEFVTAIEDHYEIEVSDEMLMQWKNVEAVTASVKALLAAKKGKVLQS